VTRFAHAEIDAGLDQRRGHYQQELAGPPSDRFRQEVCDPAGQNTLQAQRAQDVVAAGRTELRRPELAARVRSNDPSVTSTATAPDPPVTWR